MLPSDENRIMEIRFTPEHKILNELFGRDMKYVIPQYQRLYSWDCLGKSERNNQVNVMWDDLIEYFHTEGNNTYFFGSMVLISTGRQEYEVIDGQQRLTTMVLLFAAIKCFLKEIKPLLTHSELLMFVDTTITFADDLLYNKKLFGAETIEKKLKIEKNSGFDYDAVLKDAIECNAGASRSLESATAEQVNTVKRYFSNLQFLKEKLKGEFLENGVFTGLKARSLNEFIEFLKSRVSVVRILTPSFEVAYHIFEILNNRGLPLSNKDLFRNFIIKEWNTFKNSGPQHEGIDPYAKWNELEQDYELTDDFIARWAESIRAARLLYSAFNDIREIYARTYRDERPGNKIEVFYEDIKRDLGYYNRLINNDFAHPLLRGKIRFILQAPNIKYSLNYLLAALRNQQGQESPVFIKLVQHLEIMVFISLFIRFEAGPINDAIRRMNGNLPLDEDSFQKSFKKFGMGPELKNAGITDADTAKLLLAKYAWIHEAQTDDDVVDQTLDLKKCSLEHIIPQNAAGTAWENRFSREFIQEYTYRLGNMTLLTTKMNAAARNLPFAQKKYEYARTKLPMTLHLSALEDITEDFLRRRHEEITTAILQDLGINESF